MRITITKVDYEYEASRGMCDGCNKVGGWGGNRCTAYIVPPAMYVRANECPVNPRKKPTATTRTRVGQQKQAR